MTSKTTIAAGGAALGLAWLAMRRRERARSDDQLFETLLADAAKLLAAEPSMAGVLRPVTGAEDFEDAVAAIVASRLADDSLGARPLRRRLREALHDSTALELGSSPSASCRADAEAVEARDPACHSVLEAVLYFKGFHALAAHRCARRAWNRGDRAFSLWLQSRCSGALGVDIHPAATIGPAIVIDHATGVVVGETAVIGRGCTMLHGCTLGATGKDSGDRHPKIDENVLLGAGVSVLGNIRVGDGAKLGCGAVVLRPIPSGATAVGAPAKIIGRAAEKNPAAAADHGLSMVKGSLDRSWSGACVWREIAAKAAADEGGIDFPTFREAMGGEGVPEDAIGEIFFALDTDTNGKISEAEFRDGFDGVAKRLCESLGKQSALCPMLKKQLCPEQCGALRQRISAHCAQIQAGG